MGLPTLRDLFRALMQEDAREGENDKQVVLGALEHLYPHCEREGDPAYPPFEEFLSLAYAAEDLPRYKDGLWARRQKCALRLLTDGLSSIATRKRAEQKPLLRAFARGLEPGDVVVTFNWDTLVERSLVAAGKPISLAGHDPSRISILKLHGSLSWVKWEPGVKPKEPGHLLRLSPGIGTTKDYAYADVWDALDTPPLIVPPIAAKRPVRGEFFTRLWSDAYGAVKTAEKVVVIGYSMPNDDLQARGLIGRALRARRRRYVVVDPDVTVPGRFFTQISSWVDYRQAYLSTDLLTSVLGEDAPKEEERRMN
jgi:hypothetical protein